MGDLNGFLERCEEVREAAKCIFLRNGTVLFAVQNCLAQHAPVQYVVDKWAI